MTDKPIEYRILALYRFIPLTTSLESLKEELLTTLRKYEVKGTLLIAPEGINGTVCYPYPPPSNLDKEGDNVDTKARSSDDNKVDDPVANYLKNHPIFGGSELRTRLSIWKDEDDNTDDNKVDKEGKELIAKPQQAFHRLKIKIKEEIVTLGLGRPLVDRKPINNTDTDETDRQTYNEKSNPNKTKGQYLNPQQWDEACHNPNILVIDTRNTYEIDIGTFESAINPNTENFSDFPKYLEKVADEFDWDGEENGNKKKEQQKDTVESDKKKKPPPEGIAMFCTGGIRCEKATSYALQTNLFKDVPIYHLEGGILGYLDDVAKRGEDKDDDKKEDGNIEGSESSSKKSKKSSSSTFHGECFVFDKRVAVKEGLKPTSNYIQCHGCRGPMDHRLLSEASKDTTAADVNINDDASSEEVERYKQLAQGIANLPKLQYDSKTRSYYLPGLTCPRCHSSTTRDSLLRFAEREKQVEICKSKGESLFKDNAGM